MAKKLFIGVVMLLLLAGCASNAQPQNLPNTGDLQATLAPNLPNIAGTQASIDPAALQAAEQFLANQLKVDVSAIQRGNAVQVNWPDGCLGLGQAGEACTQNIVPGWSINFTVNGQTYQVRTDQTGAIIRLSP
jgi:hypothetical protein